MKTLIASHDFGRSCTLEYKKQNPVYFVRYKFIHPPSDPSSKPLGAPLKKESRL